MCDCVPSVSEEWPKFELQVIKTGLWYNVVLFFSSVQFKHVIKCIFKQQLNVPLAYLIAVLYDLWLWLISVYNRILFKTDRYYGFLWNICSNFTLLEFKILVLGMICFTVQCYFATKLLSMYIRLNDDCKYKWLNVRKHNIWWQYEAKRGKLSISSLTPMQGPGFFPDREHFLANQSGQWHAQNWKHAVPPVQCCIFRKLSGCCLVVAAQWTEHWLLQVICFFQFWDWNSWPRSQDYNFILQFE